MFRRISAIFLLGAWFCASGALLQVVQVYAWARMFAGYAETLSWSQAACLTFDPARPCPICRAVQRASEQSRHDGPASPTSESALPKLLLLCENAQPLVIGPERAGWTVRDEMPGAEPARAVPVPPPRGCARFV